VEVQEAEGRGHDGGEGLGTVLDNGDKGGLEHVLEGHLDDGGLRERGFHGNSEGGAYRGHASNKERGRVEILHEKKRKKIATAKLVCCHCAKQGRRRKEDCENLLQAAGREQ